MPPPPPLGRRTFLKSAALGAAQAAAALAPGCARSKETPVPRRPNLLFVFGDQHRGMDLGAAGNREVRSPNFDRLAAEGTRFTRAYSNSPVCTPCRGTILTGRYPQQHGAVANDLPLTEGQATIAQAMRQAGYRTGYVGKWHLDGVPRDRFTPPGPRRHGFDFWAAWNCAHAYFGGRVFRDEASAIRLEGYEPVGQTELALEFLRSADERPWCLFLSWGPPHAPYQQVPDEFKAMYDAAKLTRRPNWRQDPPSGFRRLGRSDDRQDLAGYYAHITAIDREMGRLLDALDAGGAAANTIVLYTSDHGDMLGSHGMHKKEQPWEEAIQVPLLVRWPGRVPAGRVCGRLASVVDYAPTLLALAGLDVPPEMQGADLSRLVLGEDGPGREDVLLTADVIVDQGAAQGIREWRGLRTPRYTYARWFDGTAWVLYDNEADPYQTTNLVASAEHARLRADLEAQLRARLAAAGDACLSWQETIRRLGLVDLWNRRERYMHAKAPRLLEGP